METLHNEIKSWLEKMGYTSNEDLNIDISRISYSSPSYKLMADTVLKSIRDSNAGLSPNQAWIYTTKFVDQMKSNLILNNNNFQEVLHKGLHNDILNNHDASVNILSDNGVVNSEYNYIKNVCIKNESNSKIFDFIIVIKGFPLVLIKLVDYKNESFNDSFRYLEEDFDEYPMLFNFNKLIILTDGETFKVGTLYNFPEEYIDFNDSKDSDSGHKSYKIKQLEELLLSTKIINNIKNIKTNKDIVSYLTKNDVPKDISVNEKNYNENILHINNETENNKIDMQELDEELSLLLEFFNPDLDEIIESEEFKKKLVNTLEVPDFKDNKLYIKDIQEEKNMNTVDTFVKANERLVIKEANRFVGYETTSLDFDDIYQYGYVGLLKALSKFDLSMDNEFSTYAIPWIRQSIMRGVQNDSLLIRVPVHRWESIIKLRKLEVQSEKNFGKVDYDWIAKELSITKDKLDELIIIKSIFMNNVSLDTIVGEDGATVLGEFIPDQTENVEDIILEYDLKDTIDDILKILDERSKDIIIKRFGLSGHEPMTLEEIGAEYNVTRERIRQIESKALKKLKNPIRSDKLIDHWRD